MIESPEVYEAFTIVLCFLGGIRIEFSDRTA